MASNIQHIISKTPKVLQLSVLQHVNISLKHLYYLRPLISTDLGKKVHVYREKVKKILFFVV